MKLDKKDIKYLIAIFSVFILIITVYQISFINSSYTCGTITGKMKSRGATSYKYEYNINAKSYSSSIDISYLSYRNLDSLQKMPCIEVKYSKWIPAFSKIVDKRILKE